MMPLSEKKKASNARWDSANLSRMSLAVPIEMREAMDRHIAETGETMNSFIKRAIGEAMANDKQRSAPESP